MPDSPVIQVRSTSPMVGAAIPQYVFGWAIPWDRTQLAPTHVFPVR
jgi:hypothetical protein